MEDLGLYIFEYSWDGTPITVIAKNREGAEVECGKILKNHDCDPLYRRLNKVYPVALEPKGERE